MKNAFIDLVKDKQGKEKLKTFLDSYQNVPREEKEKQTIQQKSGRVSREEEAIQEMHRLLYLLEKKLKGNLTEADKQEMEQNLTRWRDSIEILRKGI